MRGASGPALARREQEADASDCCGVGMPCAQCNPCGGIDEPPDISLSVMRVMIDAKKARDTKADGPRGSKSLLVFPDDSDAQPQALDEDLRAACQS